MKKNVHEFEIKLDKEWITALDNSFKKNNKEVKIDGFRKGSAPKDIYLKKFGIESLYNDAVNEVINIGYRKVLEENNILPVIEPSVDVTGISDANIILKFKVITRPEIKLGSYKNLGIKKEKLSVSKEEIEKEINRLRESMADMVIKDNGVVANGDTAIINFKGTVDGKVIDGGTGENYPLEIGSNSFIPGFEEKLIGAKSGETLTLNLKFPENYVEELKGKDVTFEVTVNEIKTRCLPEIDESFYKDLGFEDVKNTVELEKEIEKSLLEEKKHKAEDEFIDKCLDKASQNMKVEINEEIIDEEVHRMMAQYEQQLKMQGMDLNTYYQITGSNHDELHKQMEGEATKRVKYRYLIEEIANLEKIEFTEKEVEEKAEEMATNYGITVEELLKAYGSIDIVKYDMKMHKALEIIKENN